MFLFLGFGICFWEFIVLEGLKRYGYSFIFFRAGREGGRGKFRGN